MRRLGHKYNVVVEVRVLPHVAMSAIDLLLFHLFSLSQVQRTPVAQLPGISPAPISRAVLNRALAKPTDR